MHKEVVLNQRNGYVDCLRAIGLLSIILVHCNCPRLLYQFNLFNVPLMVFVSGYVATFARKKTFLNYFKFRLLRLIVPTYIFISGYLVFLYLLSRLGIINFFDFSFSNIISSYMLLDSSYGGIGFVWIIRVFILTMLVTPVILKINETTSSNIKYFSFVFLLVLLQLLLCNLSGFAESILYNEYLLYFLGYQVFVLGGVRINNLKKIQIKALFNIFFFFLVILISCRVFIQNVPFSNIEFKTPPYIDYQIYGLLICFMLFYYKDKLQCISRSYVLQFMGKNTMWIYYWHIPIVLLLNKVIGERYWVITFLCTTIVSVGLYYIQYWFVKKVNNKYVKKYFIG